MIKDLYGIDLSEGSIINMEENVASALQEVHERIHRFVVEGSMTRYFDETTWGSSGRRHYVWLGTTEAAAYYRIDPSRSQAAFLKLIGQATKAPAVSDRYNAYNILNGPHQYCLAHLIRDFHSFAEKRGEDGKIGAKIEGELRRICKTHTSWKQGALSRQQRGSRLTHSRRRLDDLLIEGMAPVGAMLYMAYASVLQIGTIIFGPLRRWREWTLQTTWPSGTCASLWCINEPIRGRGSLAHLFHKLTRAGSARSLS